MIMNAVYRWLALAIIGGGLALIIWSVLPAQPRLMPHVHDPASPVQATGPSVRDAIRGMGHSAEESVEDEGGE